MPEHLVLAGAEPFSAPGGPHGALVLHGFTGCPQSMRGLAQAFASAGFAVELPRLPGHGTAIEDMLETSWDDWSKAAEAAYDDLAARCDKVVVSGLSMGGTLTLWLAEHHPEIAGIVLVNAAAEPPADSFKEMLPVRPASELKLAPIVIEPEQIFWRLCGRSGQWPQQLAHLLAILSPNPCGTLMKRTSTAICSSCK